MEFSGLLLIDKPVGITSFDIIRRLRRILSCPKMGHAGTLDPFASGLLVVAIQEATKVLSELLLSEKEYIADVLFGAVSDTEDSTGNITPIKDALNISENLLKKTLLGFLGESSQKPPQYSALKIRGKRAADRVRHGEDIRAEIEAKERTIQIYEMEIITFKFPHLQLRVKCSSGTYVRSLARDLGEKLKVGAYLTELRRTAIGPFSVNDAHIIEEVNPEYILPLSPHYFALPTITVSLAEEKELRYGRKIFLQKGNALSGKILLFAEDGSCLGFGNLSKEGSQYALAPHRLLVRKAISAEVNDSNTASSLLQ
jgi:tRNA pseudouridine55 synthase